MRRVLGLAGLRRGEPAGPPTRCARSCCPTWSTRSRRLGQPTALVDISSISVPPRLLDIVIGACRRDARWLEHRDVLVLTDRGYRYTTDAGNAYDIVDCSEDLVAADFPPESVWRSDPARRGSTPTSESSSPRTRPTTSKGSRWRYRQC